MLRTRTGAIVVSVLLVLGTLAVSVGLIIVDARGGVQPRFRTDHARPPSLKKSGALVIAGSGSNVPITRRLAHAFQVANPGVDVVVHDSIGSTGGVRAVSDGVIDVGLMSRPLRAGEGEGLSTARYARVAVVIAAHPDVPQRDLTAAGLVDIYSGKRKQWSNKHKVVVIQRERGDSGHRAVAAAIPEFGKVNEDAWRRGLFRVVYSDRAMEAALFATSGAVGISDAGVIKVQGLALRTLPLSGVTKELSFVWRGALSASAARFVAFVASAEGVRILREGGYEALGAKP